MTGWAMSFFTRARRTKVAFGFIAIFVFFASFAFAQESPGIITTIAGNSGQAFRLGDGGLAKDAWLYGPTGVAIDAVGVIYIADRNNNRIRRIGTDGVITSFAGSGTTGQGAGSFSGDGGPASLATLNEPYGVALDASGNVYISDAGNNRIRRVGTDGIITTIAGNGTRGFSGDGGPAVRASLNWPTGVAVDRNGVVYIADSGNNRIRRVRVDGTITTFAGTGSDRFDGDGGPSSQAGLWGPTSVTVDTNGVIYIADTNHSSIRRVGLDGIITTIAGMGGGMKEGFSGDGGPANRAMLRNPSDIAVDARGIVYISDSGNKRIRRIGPDGTITTFVGTGESGSSGDEGPASQAKLNGPGGIAVSAKGALYITDNDRIRRVSPSSLIIDVS